jgi:hypothetical protein
MAPPLLLVPSTEPIDPVYGEAFDLRNGNGADVGGFVPARWTKDVLGRRRIVTSDVQPFHVCHPARVVPPCGLFQQPPYEINIGQRQFICIRALVHIKEGQSEHVSYSVRDLHSVPERDEPDEHIGLLFRILGPETTPNQALFPQQTQEIGIDSRLESMH